MRLFTRFFEKTLSSKFQLLPTLKSDLLRMTWPHKKILAYKTIILKSLNSNLDTLGKTLATIYFATDTLKPKFLLATYRAGTSDDQKTNQSMTKEPKNGIKRATRIHFHNTALTIRGNSAHNNGRKGSQLYGKARIFGRHGRTGKHEILKSGRHENFEVGKAWKF